MQRPDTAETRSLLLGAFFVASLLPFVSPYPLGSDVQPVAGALGLAVLLRDGAKRVLRLDAIEILFILTALLRIAYWESSEPYDYRNQLSLLFAFFVYHGWRWHSEKLTSTHLLAASSLSLAALVLHRLLGEHYVGIAQHFIRAVKVTDFDYRGPGGLTPEPSFAGAMAVVFGLLAVYLHERGSLGSRGRNLVLMQSAVALLLSNSGLGFVLAAVATSTYAVVSRGWKAKTAVLGAMTLLTITGAWRLASGRGTGAISNLVDRGAGQPLDASAAARLRSILTGLRSVQINPLGTGGGSYNDTALAVDLQYGISYSLHLQPAPSNLSAFGLHAVELGLPIVLLLGALALTCFRWNVVSAPATTIAILFIATTFTIAFPPTWILLGLSRASPDRISSESSADSPDIGQFSRRPSQQGPAEILAGHSTT